MALPTASDNVFPKIIESMNTSDPAAPSDSSWKIYAKANGIFARSSNSVVGPFAASGLSNPMTTKGDVILGDTGGTPSRLVAGSAGQFLMANGAGAFETWASRQLDYVEVTTTTTNITATTEGTSQTVITGSSVAYDGSTAIIVEFQCGDVQADNGAAGRSLVLLLYEDSTVKGQVAVITSPSTTAARTPVHVSRQLTPSNASHTYAIKAYVSAGTGALKAGSGGSGANMPIYLRITRAL